MNGSFTEQARREQIIESAISAISEHGFTGATTTQIARIAGISPGLINYYFGSKTELIMGIVRTVEARSTVALQSNLHDSGYAEALRSMLHNFVRHCTQNSPEVLALHEIRHRAPLPVRRWCEHRRQTAAGELSAFIAAGQMRGQIRAADPDVLAAMVIAMMEHLSQELTRLDRPGRSSLAIEWTSLFDHTLGLVGR